MQSLLIQTNYVKLRHSRPTVFGSLKVARFDLGLTFCLLSSLTLHDIYSQHKYCDISTKVLPRITHSWLPIPPHLFLKSSAFPQVL